MQVVVLAAALCVAVVPLTAIARRVSPRTVGADLFVVEGTRINATAASAALVQGRALISVVLAAVRFVAVVPLTAIAI